MVDWLSSNLVTNLDNLRHCVSIAVKLSVGNLKLSRYGYLFSCDVLLKRGDLFLDAAVASLLQCDLAKVHLLVDAK